MTRTGDTEAHYDRMRSRAGKLCNDLDDAVHALLNVERAVSEVARADLGLMGELDEFEHADLEHFVRSAKLSLRAAERVALLHERDLKWPTSDGVETR
jgi:hypothetical protein